MQPVSFDLKGPSVSIGRREDNDVVLSFGYISGHHAQLDLRGDTWHISDRGSTNGTRVNGEPAEDTALRPGDRISLGSLDMTFGDGPGPSPAKKPTMKTEVADPGSRAFATLADLAPAADTELEKLSLLLDLQVQWGEGFTSDETIQRILQSALTVSGAERACLLLQGEEGFRYSAGRNSRGESLSEDSFHASRNVLELVVSRGEPVFMTQGLEGALAEQKSIVAMNLRAVGCLPLRRRERGSSALLGILYLDSQATMHTLSGLDERILLKLAGEAETVLERVELIGVREERQRLERELELARQTQEGLLPRQIPVFSGWALEALCRPTRHVGGDFYDFIALPDGRLATLLADVSGKGVAASLVSSSVQGALQMMLRRGEPTPAAFRAINDYLCERSEEGRFVTVFAALLSPDGALHWANAGHNPAYLVRGETGSIEELEASGTILGTLPSEAFGVVHSEQSTILGPEDLLVIYSDGLTEATAPNGEFFGEERLIELLIRYARAGAGELRARIMAALEEFTRGAEQSDDITLVLAERRP
jgi:sigma-B regulation protein RsbU (phosphoserine phosphatase)